MTLLLVSCLLQTFFDLQDVWNVSWQIQDFVRNLQRECCAGSAKIVRWFFLIVLLYEMLILLLPVLVSKFSRNQYSTRASTVLDEAFSCSWSCFKKNLNASKPTEHPPNSGGKSVEEKSERVYCTVNLLSIHPVGARKLVACGPHL